jgi:nitrogen-specific signal transduction histidine kinase
VRDHGGDIRVSSEPGRGATFVVSVPVASEAQSHSSSTALEVAKVASVGS